MRKTLLASCFAAALLFVACGGGDSVSSVSNGNTGQTTKPSTGGGDKDKTSNQGNKNNSGNSGDITDSSDALPKGESTDLKGSGAGVLNSKKVAFEQLRDASGDIPPQPILN